jgi:hypothetical protein
MTNKYGFDVSRMQQDAGATQRGIESEGIAADYGQFKEERDDPFKKVQYMQSLLQGMPVEAQSATYSQPTGLSSLLGSGGDILTFLTKMGFDPTSLLGGSGATKMTRQQRVAELVKGGMSAADATNIAMGEGL